MKTRLLLSITISFFLLFLTQPAAITNVDAVSLTDDYNSQGLRIDNTTVATTVPTFTVTSEPTTTYTPDPTFTSTFTPQPTFTPEPTFTPTALPTEIPTAEPIKVSQPSNAFPSLDEFAAEVRSAGMQGIWAENLFAFKFYNASWGSVPGSWNTASLASYEGYKAFFIHNYLGGTKLYNVGSGTRVAVIWANSIEWFQINGVYRIAGVSTGDGCGYSEPFTPWNGGDSLTALDIVQRYYSSPFAIQTCICSGDKNGIFILTGA
jgi:hypothetical protein